MAYEREKTRKEIGLSIGRNISTISREIRRNSDYVGYFYPHAAQQAVEKRKVRHGSKIMRNPSLKEYSIEKMKKIHLNRARSFIK